MKLVLIEWLDSHAGNGWQPLDELETSAKPMRCRSVGWLLADRADTKIIVPHISGESDGVRPCGCGDMAIPTKLIQRMVELTIPAPKPARSRRPK